MPHLNEPERCELAASLCEAQAMEHEDMARRLRDRAALLKGEAADLRAMQRETCDSKCDVICKRGTPCLVR